MKYAMPFSPVEVALRGGPRGKADWPGYDTVYVRLQRAAHNLAKGTKVFQSWSYRSTITQCLPPSEDHVDLMAAMGSGHEERMKSMLMKCLDRGWLSATDINETAA